MNTRDFTKMKQKGEKIAVITCYDAWSAKIIEQTDIDAILVGDSAAMVMHGHASTITATSDMISTHIKAVAKTCGKKFIIADMPFLSTRKGLVHCMDQIQRFIQAGAQAIKIEGVDGQLDLIEHIITAGVPVMGHIGLTMQTMYQSGLGVKGRNSEDADLILNQAKLLEKAGCFALLLEVMPPSLAKLITEQVKIATIGIGAGPETDGQVLVLHDMLGLYTDMQPKFVKHYINGFDLIKQAITDYTTEVKKSVYPAKEHTYI